MKCLRCQHENPPQSRFCFECGARLAPTCSGCGAELPAGVKFCNQCGQAAEDQVPAKPRLVTPETYTPKHLAEKILTSKSALEGERKQVTVLFADLKGSMELLADRDPEEARKILDPVLQHMMEAVHRYEGTVNQVMGDGIMALFGAPLAHEDHAVRACYAALRMQESVRAYAEDVRRTTGIPPSIRIGLNSGEVVVRSVGSDLRMDYTAVGQTTHLAARMEQAALPGTIVITRDTLQLAEGYVQVKPLGPMSVKGLSKPVEAYEVTRAGPVRTRLQAGAARGLSRFVGRGPEIEQLHKALEHAQEGRGQVVAVVGEPGVGKSRLFYELTRSYRVHGWLILESGSFSYGKATAYLPVIDLLKAYFEVDKGDDTRKIREKITGKLVSLDRQLEPSLAPILSLLEVPVEDAAWEHLDPRQRRQQTLDGVKRLLLRESQVQPLLVVFEDLHWIDSETQAFLDSLVESLPTARLLLLINYRPEYEHGWTRKTYYTQVRIDPLPPESAAELLDALLGADPSLEGLKQLLVERTDGNPFFLEESVRALAEAKALVGERGTYRFAGSLEDIQVPATVQTILGARIDRLPLEGKRLLQCAAVIGQGVPFTLLQVVAEETEEQLLRELGQLVAGEFLYETRLFPELEYRFKHALTLEVAYHGMLRERRQALHERALNALDSSLGGRGSENVELLAHHAVRGELWDRAARYLYQAGEKAFAQGRYHASADFSEAAVEALDRLGDAADVTLKLDACLELWSARIAFGQYDGLSELAAQAETLARALDDGPRLAQVQVRHAQAIAFSGVMPGTLQSAIEKAREAFERGGPGDLRTQSYARFIVGLACRDLGRLVEAMREFEAGIALFEQIDPRGKEAGFVFPICASLHAWHSEACATSGDFRRALASAREAMRLAMDIGHPSSLTVAHQYLGIVHLIRGEMATAVPFLERGLAIASEHDLSLAMIRASVGLAYTLVVLGDRDRGLECLVRARERWAERSRAGQWFGYGTVTGYGTITASTYLAAGCSEDARTEIRQGLAAVAERGARGHRAPLLRLEAELLAAQDPAGACDRLEEALALATELSIRTEVAHCHLGLGKLDRRTGKREQGQEHLSTATTMYREMDMRFWLDEAEAELAALG